MKILKILLLFLIFSFTFLQVRADSIPVENIFVDIDSDYKYIEELQLLYDRWMIYPDNNWKFNPKQLLNRDDFVGILMETTCTDCLQPDTDFNLVNTYKDSYLFFDINNQNKNFYCIAEAKDKSIVRWYDIWTTCENWIVKSDEAPFCPANNIILEEALAVVLRASQILTNDEAYEMVQEINNWVSYPDLSDDVKPKISNWNAYSFYPYFYKALNYEIYDYDENGNQEVYKLIEVWEDNNLRPKQAITKEDFLKIAFVTLKANACSEKIDYDIWLEMQIKDKTCTESNIETCSLAKLNSEETVYDFFPEVAISEDDSIDEETGYIWRFYNTETWEQEIVYWKYVDNYDFLEEGDYRVYLRVITENGSTWEVYNDIHISANSSDIDWDGILDENDYQVETPIDKIYYICTQADIDAWSYNCDSQEMLWVYSAEKEELDIDWDGILDEDDYQVETPIDKTDYICTQADIDSWSYNCDSQEMLWVYSAEKETSLVWIIVSIDADPIYGNSPLYVDFESFVSNEEEIVSYFWDFWDGSTWVWAETNHIFWEVWVYEVTLTVEDSYWNTYSSTVLIYVDDIVDINSDIDQDGILDIDDSCVLVYGVEENSGCPIFENLCKQSSECSDWYFCDETAGYCKAKVFSNSCEYTWWDLVYGNVSCNSCPCNNKIDFVSVLRKCDIIFPAITSPDFSEIYSKWENFQIK